MLRASHAAHAGLFASIALTLGSVQGPDLPRVAVPVGTPASPERVEPPISVFYWGDFDCDGRLDAYASTPGAEARLLRNAGEGRFEDVTEAVGLPLELRPAQAAWEDVDGDGHLDLLLAGRDFVQLWRNTHGKLFEDLTKRARIELDAPLQWAEWIDWDGDGRADLHLATERAHVLQRNRGGFEFEPVELDLPQGERGAEGAGGGVHMDRERRDRAGLPVAPTSGGGASGSGSSGSLVAGPGSIITAGSPHLPAAAMPVCPDTIHDQFNLMNCIAASSMPTLGLLYPLGPDFNVTTTGRVGIGTTNPGDKLEVAGGGIKVGGSSGSSYHRADGQRGLRLGTGANASELEFLLAGVRKSLLRSDTADGMVWELPNVNGTALRVNAGVNPTSKVDFDVDVEVRSLLFPDATSQVTAFSQNYQQGIQNTLGQHQAALSEQDGEILSLGLTVGAHGTIVSNMSLVGGRLRMNAPVEAASQLFLGLGPTQAAFSMGPSGRIDVTSAGGMRVTNGVDTMDLQVTPGGVGRILATRVELQNSSGEVARMRPTSTGVRFDGTMALFDAAGVNSAVLSTPTANTLALNGVFELGNLAQLQGALFQTSLLGGGPLEARLGVSTPVQTEALHLDNGSVHASLTLDSYVLCETCSPAPIVVADAPVMAPQFWVYEAAGGGASILRNGALPLAGSSQDGMLRVDGLYSFVDSIVDVGCGVYGHVSNATGSSAYGVYGRTTASNSTTRIGVLGESDGGATGTGFGVKGYAFGASGASFGVHGTSASATGTGVRGIASALTGTNYGVYGQCTSPAGFGVYSQGDAYVTGAAGSAANAMTIQANSGGTGFQRALRLWGTEGTFDWGGRLNFGDSDFVYLWEDLDDHLRVHGTTRFDDRVTIFGAATQTTYELDVVGDVRCVSLLQTSDARLKRDVRELGGALDQVLALRGVSFEWDRTARPSASEERQIGFLAQEVRKVVPEAVSEDDDGMLSVAYTSLVPVLVEAVKEQQRRIVDLEAQVRVLSGHDQTGESVLERPALERVRQAVVPERSAAPTDVVDESLAAEVARLRHALAALEERVAGAGREPRSAPGERSAPQGATAERLSAGLLPAAEVPVKGAPLPEKELAARAAAGLGPDALPDVGWPATALPHHAGAPLPIDAGVVTQPKPDRR